MAWESPSAEQLRQILERANVPALEIERTLKLYAAPKLVRWSEMDREFARRALTHRARRRQR